VALELLACLQMRAIRFVRWSFVCAPSLALPRDASAQLLSSLLQPVVNTVTCAPPLSSSPMLAGAARKWAGADVPGSTVWGSLAETPDGAPIA
jgi:hypothetical protein